MPWMIPAAIVASGAIGAGASIYGANKAGDNEWDPQYLQLPDYPESTGARQDWWSKLQDWGKSGTYGATDMNWDEIFNTAKGKLSRYYWGGVNDPGLAGKVRASAARRGASQSPALENQLTSMGQQESIDLNDLFSNLTTQKATYTESARNTWLQSMMNLAGMKPSYMTSSGTTSGYGAGNAIADVGGGISSLFSQYAKSKQTEDLYKQLFNNAGGTGGSTSPATSQSTLLGSNDDELMDILNSFKKGD